MTNEFEELENKIKNSQQGSDYLLSDDGRGKRSYTIFSDGLKQSLRDIIHSTVFGGWQISHTLGKNSIEYKKEEDGKFGFYRKALVASLSDEFLIVLGNQTSKEKEEFEKSRQRVEASERRVEESERRLTQSERRVEESERRLEGNLENDNSVSFSVEWNERGEKISTARKQFASLSEEQAFRESPGWKMAQAVAKAMASVGNKQNSESSSTSQQQAQIRQGEPLKIPFPNSPQDKGGNK